MKHNVKITLVLLGMFIISQFIGLAILTVYAPTVDGNLTSYNLPFGMDPPSDIEPATSLTSIILAIIIAVFIMFLLMKIKAGAFLRLWFFIVVILAIAISINAPLLSKTPHSALIALAIALPLAYYKIFKRNIIIHNLSELIIYPGIAAIFVPLLNLWSIIILLIIISLYDMYAVWHAGFMQKMAQYQIDKVKVFSGFFIPYLNKKQKAMVKNSPKNAKGKDKKMNVSVALLGGGDVVFPMMLSGVLLHSLGLLPAILTSFGATLGLASLFYYSEKGKFYPAMPFITAGCFVALGFYYLVL